jgi:hypothetical protein
MAVDETKVFTWIEHEINETMLEWLHQLNFTDVCVRYVTPEQANESKKNLDKYSIGYWKIVSPYAFSDGKNEKEFETLLQEQIETSPSRNIMIDDCQVLFCSIGVLNDTQRMDLIQAIKNIKQNNILLAFYATYFYEVCDHYDFTGLDVDIGCLPHQMTTNIVEKTKQFTKSLGIYLWVLAGYGLTWENVTETEVETIYSIAQQYSVQRFFVWMGHETDDVENGMSLSSLYNYPNWWTYINSMNYKLREHIVIPEFSMWIMLPIMIPTSLFVYWKKRRRT